MEISEGSIQLALWWKQIICVPYKPDQLIRGWISLSLPILIDRSCECILRCAAKAVSYYLYSKTEVIISTSVLIMQCRSLWIIGLWLVLSFQADSGVNLSQ